MKRILFLVLLFVVSTVVKAQYPVTQFLGSDSAMVKSRGGLQGRFAPIPFTDTTAANLSRISQYPGALIYTSGVDKYWYRNATTTAWIEFTSSGGSTVNIYNSNGTISEDRYVDGGEHRLQFNSLQSFQVAADSITFNLVENYLFLTGLVSTQDTSTYKPIVVDPITGRVLQSSYWYGGSSIDTTSLSNRINAKADSNNVWKTTGTYNTSPSTNYIGTADLQPLVFKVNGIHAGFLTARAEPTSAGSGSVVLGQYAGQILGTNNGANTLIGHGAGAQIKYNPSKANQNTFIGLWAGYGTKYHSDPFGGRSVLVGQSAGFWNYDGSSLAGVGCFALEMNNRGNNLTALGRDALRSNIDGSYSTAVGSLSLLNNTTGIKTISVTNGGSGYTSATVTISAPPGPTPGVAWANATATATISGGAITGIVVTDPGAGYSINYADSNSRHPVVTVTITGDGTGAAASVTETWSATGNTAMGHGSGYLNKYGNYNIELGYLSTLNTWGDYNILMGYQAGPGTGAPTIMSNGIAIGKNAKVSANNSMALGGTGADTIRVGINTETPRKKLDVVGGDILVHEHTIGRGPGSIATNTVFGTNIATSSTTAFGNTLMGYEVAANGTVSSANLIMGYRAGNSASYAGTGNIILGYEASYLNRANESVAIGLRSMYTQGSNGSVGVGAYSLYNNVRNTSIARAMNTAVGDYSLYSYTGASSFQINTGYGAYSGYGITTGSYNTPIGALSMGKGWSGVGVAGSSGNFNTSLGYASLYYQNNSSGNIGIGPNAFNNSSFDPSIGYNIGIGYEAGKLMTTGNYNVFLGGYTGSSHATVSKHIVFSDGQGNIRFTSDSVGNTSFYGTGGHKFQIGTTAQRPTNVAGTMRWNTDSSALEYADGSSWFTIGTSAGGSGTVTSVGTGYGLSGGTITTTGTILVDSASLSNYYLRRKDSLTSSNLLGYVTRTVLADSASAIRSAIIGGGTPAGNYGNIQLNRNGAFAAAGSDSLNFTGGAITVKGEMTMNGASPVLNFGTAAGNPEIAATASSLIFRRNDLGAYIGVTLGDIDAGANKFVVTGGNILKINNVATSFPSSQGAANSFLMNNGSGTLTWDASVVLNTRTISTTSPLSGGGDLSANRTLSIADAAADGTTKGAASFTASDFNSSAANISIDYTNGQKATSVQPGFMTATQAAKLDSNIYFQSGEGVEIYVVNDSTYGFKLKYDTTALASFGAGSAAAGDTTAFSTSAIYGSFFNSGSDTLIITRMQIGLQGTSPNITLDVFWNDSLNVSAGATKLVTAGNTATNIYTGTSVTSFDNTKIPPGNWVWVKSSTVAVKPTYLTTTLIGYKKRVTP